MGNQLGQGLFADPAFMTHLDVAFANLYFGAVDTADNPAAVPLAWRPLVELRADAGIEPIQFALAGMNVHINHDLPLAMVSAYAGIPPNQGSAGSFVLHHPLVAGLATVWPTTGL